MLPPFLAPIQRPDTVQPFLTVDLRDGDGSNILQTIFDLIHGKNYNDPQRFLSRDYHKLKSSLQHSSPSFQRFGT
jgi:cyanobactin biosynthesis protein (PatB/AcyB/McaB family)